MMMIYGMFVFELRTLPHQQLQQNKSWRHVKNERVNRSASWQYIGAGDDRIVLSGVLYPEITGGEVSLSLLTTQAYTGRPWPLPMNWAIWIPKSSWKKAVLPKRRLVP